MNPECFSAKSFYSSTLTPEKMEITSLPGPDRTITDEDIANSHLVSRRYRNRRIGDFLKELKLAEGRNTRIPTILKAMKDNQSEPLVFKTDSERSYFTVILPIQKKFLPIEKPATVSADKQKGKTRKNKTVIKEQIIETLERKGNLSASETV